MLCCGVNGVHQDLRHTFYPETFVCIKARATFEALAMSVSFRLTGLKEVDWVPDVTGRSLAMFPVNCHGH